MGAARHLYDQAVDCFNRHHLDDLMAIVSDDCVLVRPGWGEYKGAACADYFRALWDMFPDMTMHPTRYIEQGDDLAVESSWSGTNTGPVHLSDSQTLPPTGRRVTGRMVDIARVPSGRLSRSEAYNYGRSVDTLAQLGLIPGEALAGQP